MAIRPYLLTTGLGLALINIVGQASLGQSVDQAVPTLQPSEDQVIPAVQPVERAAPTAPQPIEQAVPASKQPVEQAVPATRLNRNSKLLQVPRKSSEVAIKINQPITFQQAYELALRNNLNLRVAELQLQQSMAALRQAQAAKWPTVFAQSDFTQTDSATFAPNPSPFAVDVGTQQQTQQRTNQNFATQLGQSQQELASDLQEVQLRLQQDQSLSQQQIFNQQIQQLQARTTVSATPFATPNETPLFPIEPDSLSQNGFNDAETELSASVTATYNIFTSGLRASQIKAAQTQVKISELALKQQLEQLRLNVANDYYNVQQTSALIEVSDDAIRNATASLRVAKLREQAGLGTKFDVLQAEVQLADTLQNAARAKAVKRNAQRQLAQQLNVSETVELEAADQVTIAGGWLLTREESIVLALQKRVELEQILNQRQLAVEQRRIALAVNRPQVQAFASVNAEEQLNDGVSGSLGYQVGVQVNLNVFDGGAAKSRAAQQEEDIAIAETQFAETKNDLRLEVEQAYASLQSNLRNVNTAQSSVQLAEESLELARLRFSAGIGTQLDITSAEASLTQSKGNLISAILDYNRAIASIQRATSYTQPITDVTPLGG